MKRPPSVIHAGPVGPGDAEAPLHESDGGGRVASMKLKQPEVVERFRIGRTAFQHAKVAGFGFIEVLRLVSRHGGVQIFFE